MQEAPSPHKPPSSSTPPQIRIHQHISSLQHRPNPTAQKLHLHHQAPTTIHPHLDHPPSPLQGPSPDDDRQPRNKPLHRIHRPLGRQHRPKPLDLEIRSRPSNPRIPRKPPHELNRLPRAQQLHPTRGIKRDPNEQIPRKKRRLDETNPIAPSPPLAVQRQKNLEAPAAKLIPRRLLLASAHVQAIPARLRHPSRLPRPRRSRRRSGGSTGSRRCRSDGWPGPRR